MTPVFELKDLHVTLRQHRHATELVKGVSFAVEPGECLGILGESGSGKSTMGRVLCGLLRPDSGEALPCPARQCFRESLCWRRAGRNCAAYVAARWALYCKIQ